MGEGRRGDSDRGATDRPTGRRLPVPEAAEALSITADAVRSRIKRGTLHAEREGGRVFVVLGATDPPTDPTDDLREQVRYLRDQLRREQDAHEQTRRLLGGALERIPAIEAPQDQPESPQTVEEEPGGSPRPDAAGPQTATDSPPASDIARPWWRRIFGG